MASKRKAASISNEDVKKSKRAKSTLTKSDEEYEERKAVSTSSEDDKKSKRSKSKLAKSDEEHKEKKTKTTSLSSKNTETDEAPDNLGKQAEINENFGCDNKTSDGRKWNFKISSWNVNGIRALVEKNGLSSYLTSEEPDVFCIQETKCSKEKIPLTAEAKGYKAYWLSGDTEGYSGVGLYTKVEPIKITYGIDMEEHDKEGRVITAEFDKFYVVNAYVPNSGRNLVRLDYRKKWDIDFRSYLQGLDKKKPVVLTGDLNVAHTEIDLANPKNNRRNAGYTVEERDAFSALLESGFVDSFRTLNPGVKGAYTFWTYLKAARARNVGWRLDYFVVSERLMSDVCESTIRSKVHGSDHCPVTLFLAV